LTLGGVVLTVNADRAVVERQLGGGELACPSCGGVLARRGNGTARRVRLTAGPEVVLVPRRSRCRGAGRRMCCCRPGAWPGGPMPVR